MEIGFELGVSCYMGLESSCEDRQGQGFGCRIYLVSNQNKRFNFTRLASKNWKTLISKS